MTLGDRLATDVLRMQEARSWTDLETVCRDLDARYEVEGAHPEVQRAYETIKTRHAKRLARTVTA